MISTRNLHKTKQNLAKFLRNVVTIPSQAHAENFKHGQDGIITRNRKKI